MKGWKIHISDESSIRENKELKTPKTKETTQQSKANYLNQNTRPIVFSKEISSLYLTHGRWISELILVKGRIQPNAISWQQLFLDNSEIFNCIQIILYISAPAARAYFKVYGFIVLLWISCSVFIESR